MDMIRFLHGPLLGMAGSVAMITVIYWLVMRFARFEGQERKVVRGIFIGALIVIFACLGRF